MIEIYAQDSFIAIMPLDGKSLPDAVRVYNCGNEARFATGHDGGISIYELSSLLERIKSSDNEFISEISIKAQGKGEDDILRFAGLCSGILDAGTLWIKQLSILPEYRRRGIGTRAMDVLLKYAVRSHNVREVYLSVAEKNIAGLLFWKKLGFYETHRFEKPLFGEKIPMKVIIMQKNLP